MHIDSTLFLYNILYLKLKYILNQIKVSTEDRQKKKREREKANQMNMYELVGAQYKPGYKSHNKNITEKLL